MDTNIIIYFLSGDRTIADLIDQKTVYVSFVTQLRISSFLMDCVIIDINSSIKNVVIDLRRTYRLKLPDSIIIASALHLDLPVITADKAFQKVDQLETVYYERD